MDLFDHIPDPATLARATDPATSVAAAVEVAPHVSALERWAAECVRRTPGATARELERAYCPADPRKLAKRLDGAAKRGLVRRGEPRRCTESGKLATTWYPAGDAE